MDETDTDQHDEPDRDVRRPDGRPEVPSPRSAESPDVGGPQPDRPEQRPDRADRAPRRERREEGGEPDEAWEGGAEGTRRPFPVLAEQRLGPPARRHLRLFRDPASLPDLRPGCVYVFGSRNRFTENRDGRPTGREPDLIEADSISVVDVRPRVVRAHLRIHSASAATEFVVRVSFDVKVTSAEAVAADGTTDLTGSITSVLAQDPTLLEYHHRYRVDDIADVRTQVSAYLMATYRQRPPRFDGLRLFLSSVEVFTPRKLRRHASVVQDATWKAAQDKLEREEEIRRVAHERNLLATPDTAWAAAVASGDATRGQVAERLSAGEQERQQRAYAQLSDMRAAGDLNHLPNHQRRIVEAGVDSLTSGSDGPRPEPVELPRQQLQGEDLTADDEPPLYVPPEDADDDDGY